MVGHWARNRGPGAIRSMVINGLGALATGATLLVVLVAKFKAGAWVSALLIAAIMAAMLWVRRHYRAVARETALTAPLKVENIGPPIVIVPIHGWSTISQRALQFALSLSQEIYAVHVVMEDEPDTLQQSWCHLVEYPVELAGAMPPNLVTLQSPFRLVLKPILEYVLEAERKHPGRQIAVVVPELVERHWYHYPPTISAPNSSRPFSFSTAAATSSSSTSPGISAPDPAAVPFWESLPSPWYV